MKRGFLNSKNTKQRPIYEGAPSAPVKAAIPERQEPSAPDTNKVSVEGVKGLTGYYSESTQATEGIDHDPFQVSVTRIPPIAKNQPKECFSSCIFPVSTSRKILEIPGFPQPVPKPHLPNLFTIKPAPEMGLGVFAKHNIRAHELIFAERPLFVKQTVVPVQYVEGLTDEVEALENYRKCLQRSLEQALDMMTPDDAKAFRSLMNCHHEIKETLFGILRTNAIGIKIFKDENKERLGGYGAVGKVGSRFNHSCTPNAVADFDVQSFSIKYMAIKNIDAGKEIFISYCDYLQSAKERREELKSYRFVCQCTACMNATPESDKFRQELEERASKVLQRREAMFADPKFNVRSLDPLLKLERDILKESLEAHKTFPYLLDIIAEGYIKLGNRTKLQEYIQKIQKCIAPTK